MYLDNKVLIVFVTEGMLLEWYWQIEAIYEVKRCLR